MSNETKRLDPSIIILDENDSEYICVRELSGGNVTNAFMIPKVKPFVKPHRRYRVWEDEAQMCFVGSNNSAAKECDFWHTRRSSVDEMEPDYFLKDAVDEWNDICRGI